MAQPSFPSPDDYASFFELCRDEETSSFRERQAHCLRRICTGLSGGCVTALRRPRFAAAPNVERDLDSLDSMKYNCWPCRVGCRCRFPVRDFDKIRDVFLLAAEKNRESPALFGPSFADLIRSLGKVRIVVARAVSAFGL